MNDALSTIFSTQSRKAWFGAVITFLGTLQVAIGEGGTFADVTTYEWFGVVIVTLTAFGGVYAVGNGDAPSDLPGRPTLPNDVEYLKKLEQLAATAKPFHNRVDSSSSAPATMNTVKASDV